MAVEGSCMAVKGFLMVVGGRRIKIDNFYAKRICNGASCHKCRLEVPAWQLEVPAWQLEVHAPNTGDRKMFVK